MTSQPSSLPRTWRKPPFIANPLLRWGLIAATIIYLVWVSYTLRSEEHTSELQSLMRISYAVLCLKKKKIKNIVQHQTLLHRIIPDNVETTYMLTSSRTLISTILEHDYY